MVPPPGLGARRTHLSPPSRSIRRSTRPNVPPPARRMGRQGGIARMHDPRVPETLEGWSVLHQMFRVRWSEWRSLAAPDRGTRAAEAAQALAGMTRGAEG